MATDNPVGRPPIVTDEVVQKLREGFLKGLTDVECCLYAGISRSTLHNYQVEHPEFISKKEEWKNKPLLTAKLNLVDSIEEGDLNNSKWYLERKNKAEFSTSTDLNIGGQESGVPLNLKVNWCDKPTE